jgi:hypothetical protein
MLFTLPRGGIVYTMRPQNLLDLPGWAADKDD